MPKRLISTLILSAVVSFCFLDTLYAAHYKSRDSLRVVKIELCLDKPKGYGRYIPSGNNEFGKNDLDIYVYLEVENCKPARDANLFLTTLALDMDIYYNDGVCIYSQEEVNISINTSLANNSNSYIWAKIDTRYLKEGEYKVEMTVRDENSRKEAFALTRFTKIDASTREAQR
ncbi:MAG: hypothetical protein V3S04_00675 [Candidatus Omnitrophota bacterium]